MLVGIFSLLTSFISLIYMNIMISKIEEITAKDATLAAVSNNISILMLDARREEKNFIIYLDTTYISKTKSIIEEVRSNINRAQSIAPEYSVLFDSMSTLVRQYSNSIESLDEIFQKDPRALTSIQQQILRYEERLKKTIGKGSIEEDSLPAWISDLNVLIASAATKASTEKMRLLTGLRESSDIIVKLAQDIAARAQTALTEHGEEGVKSGLRAQRNALTVFIITGIVLLYLIIYLPHRILLPFNQIVNVLKAIGRGDTEVNQLNLKKGDEFETLYTSFQEATQKLQQFNVLKSNKIVTMRKQLSDILAEIKEAVIILSHDLKIITYNDTASQLFGLNDDITGKNIRDINALWRFCGQELYEGSKKKITFKKKIKKNDAKSRTVIIIPTTYNTASDIQFTILIK